MKNKTKDAITKIFLASLYVVILTVLINVLISRMISGYQNFIKPEIKEYINEAKK